MRQFFAAAYCLPALLLVLAITGCAIGPRFLGPIALVSNSDIAVVRAAARQKPDGILVGGDVRRTNGYAGPVPGHLHVVGSDGAGNVVATTDAPWGEFMTRRFRLAYFNAYLRTADSSRVAKISVEAVTSQAR